MGSSCLGRNKSGEGGKKGRGTIVSKEESKGKISFLKKKEEEKKKFFMKALTLQ